MVVWLAVLLTFLGTNCCAYSAHASCDAARGRWLRPAVLGRCCGTHPEVRLSGTVCARTRTRRARSIRGHEMHVVSARSLQSALRNLRYREPVLVLFYGRHCPFSARVLPVFASVTSQLPVCSIAVHVKQLPALGAAFGVHGLPTILRIQRGRTNLRYSGNRSFEHMLEWAANVTRSNTSPPRKVPSHVPLLHIPNRDNEPDWALAASIAICALAAVLGIVDSRKKQALTQ